MELSGLAPLLVQFRDGHYQVIYIAQISSNFNASVHLNDNESAPKYLQVSRKDYDEECVKTCYKTIMQWCNPFNQSQPIVSCVTGMLFVFLIYLLIIFVQLIKQKIVYFLCKLLVYCIQNICFSFFHECSK